MDYIYGTCFGSIKQRELNLCGVVRVGKAPETVMRIKPLQTPYLPITLTK
jgi:hypothetical protein